MKNYIQKLYLLPLLGFFTAGCSTTSNLQTSEVDDVYFSSADRVTYVAPAAETRVDPEYSNESGYAEDIEGRVSDPETYARDNRRSADRPYQYSYYDAPFGNPFYAFHDPFYYPGRFYSRGMMMSPWMDPWYDPFYGPGMGMMYDPFMPRYGSGVFISVGMGWGRAYNPWGYGYGMYSPYRYGGYYGGGMYDGFYGGNAVAARPVHYAPRQDRSSNTAGRNPNINREGRNSVIEPSSRSTRSSTAQTGEINRSRRSADQGTPNAPQTGRTREVRSSSSQNSQGDPSIRETRTREMRTSPPVRSSEGTSTPPLRGRRDQPAPSTQRTETRREVTPSRSSYEPSRSSYEPSRSSSSGSTGSGGGRSSSGSGRRGN